MKNAELKKELNSRKKVVRRKELPKLMTLQNTRGTAQIGGQNSVTPANTMLGHSRCCSV